MTTPAPTPTRRASTPAYYLGRPAAFWQAVLASRSTTGTPASAADACTAHRSSAGDR
jgi:hypothetical protein